VVLTMQTRHEIHVGKIQVLRQNRVTAYSRCQISKHIITSTTQHTKVVQTQP